MNFREDAPELLEGLMIGVCRVRMALPRDVGTTSLNRSTFDRIPFSRGRLWLDYDFRSIRYHWIEIGNETSLTFRKEKVAR